MGSIWMKILKKCHKYSHITVLTVNMGDFHQERTNIEYTYDPKGRCTQYFDKNCIKLTYYGQKTGAKTQIE